MITKLVCQPPDALLFSPLQILLFTRYIYGLCKSTRLIARLISTMCLEHLLLGTEDPVLRQSARASGECGRSSILSRDRGARLLDYSEQARTSGSGRLRCSYSIAFTAKQGFL